MDDRSATAVFMPSGSGKTMMVGRLDSPNPSSPLTRVIQHLQERAPRHPIGDLQEIRKELKGRHHRAGPDTFASMVRSRDDSWAYHRGGRKELQFNLGLETIDGAIMLRHGVAFSLEASRSYPDLVPLLEPKIKLFNEYLRIHPERLAGYRMWHQVKEHSSPIYPVSSIPAELVAPATFIFLGRLQLLDRPDYQMILNDLDDLLDLYRFVEGGGRLDGGTPSRFTGYHFHPGCKAKAGWTTATPAQRMLDVDLRHNRLQECLYRGLAKHYERDTIGTEQEVGPGIRVDLVLRQPEGDWYFEIKTETSARACIRQALGQLLEYGFWPGHQAPARLVIAGEPVLDLEAKAYLSRLQERFGLPVTYIQVVLA